MCVTTKFICVKNGEDSERFFFFKKVSNVQLTIDTAISTSYMLVRFAVLSSTIERFFFLI